MRPTSRPIKSAVRLKCEVLEDRVVPAAFSIANVTNTEGNTGPKSFDFTVSLDAPESQTVTVAFTTVDGTATAADDDYETTAGTLTFAPGQTTMTVTVPVNGDTKLEFTESFTVVLSGATGGATINDDTGVGTITNDDAPPTVSVGDASATEGSPVVFPLTLSNPTDQTVTVRVNTTGGTATADVDYNNINSFFDVVFAPGVTTQTVSVPSFDDATDEPDETFFMNVLSTTNATVADGQGIGTIVDNDPPTVTGTAGADTLIVTATSDNDGAYSLNGGAPVVFTDLASLSFAGLGSNDLLRIINPAGGLFAPVNGIFFDCGGQAGVPGDSLEILGGAHTGETHTFSPNGPHGHNGRIALVNAATTANYTYTGLEPVLINAGTPTTVIFNLPTGDGNNQAILEDNGAAADNMSQIRSLNSTFETTVFVNPTDSLTVNYSNDGESVTVARLDAAFAPAMALDLNGGAGLDVLRVDFASGGAT